MKTALNRSIIIVIALVVITLVHITTTDVARSAAPVRVAAEQQPVPVYTGGNYNEVLNALFAGGR